MQRCKILKDLGSLVVIELTEPAELTFNGRNDYAVCPSCGFKGQDMTFAGQPPADNPYLAYAYHTCPECYITWKYVPARQVKVVGGEMMYDEEYPTFVKIGGK